MFANTGKCELLFKLYKLTFFLNFIVTYPWINFQEKILEEDNRCLAETHYQLGVAHSFSDDFDKAIESFKAAMKVIEMRITNLEKQIKEKKEWTEEQKKKDGK